MLPGEEDALDPGKYGDLLEEGQSLLDLALRMPHGRELPFKDDRFGFFVVVMGLFAKSIKTFRGIHLLCSHGLCEDAHALERTLGEILTNIRYLANSEERVKLARRFFDYTIIQDSKLIEATERNPALRGLFPDEAKQRNSDYLEGAKSRLPEEEFNSLYGSQGWHGKSVESLMHSVGLQSLYDLTFRLGSRAIHATDLFDHVDFSHKDGFVLKCLPGDWWAEPVLGTSNLNFLEILNHVNKVAKLGVDQEIHLAFQNLMSRHRLT